MEKGITALLEKGILGLTETVWLLVIFGLGVFFLFASSFQGFRWYRAFQSQSNDESLQQGQSIFRNKRVKELATQALVAFALCLIVFIGGAFVWDKVVIGMYLHGESRGTLATLGHWLSIIIATVPTPTK